MTDNPRSIKRTIDAIRSAFAGDNSAAVQKIPKSRVIEWMKSPDLEVQGALYAKLSERKYVERIEPALEFDDYYTFVVPYLERCIEVNPSSEWSDSRYIAGHQLVAWIMAFWNDNQVPRSKLTEIKDGLAALYRRGDDGVRDAVTNAVLEHLFENRQLVTFFDEWQNDPLLVTAYRDALLWKKPKKKR